MTIKRDHYLNQLVVLRGNGLVKVITGIRRCGKSYLLFVRGIDTERKKGYHSTT